VHRRPEHPTCTDCVLQATIFYLDTRIIASPNRAEIAPTQSSSTQIVVVFRTSADYDFENFDALPHAVPGLTISLVSTDPASRFGTSYPSCTLADFPAGLAPSDPQNYTCLHYRLDVGADASAGGDYEFVLSAQFTSTINEPPIERVESFRVAVAVPPPPPLPGFNLSLGSGPKVYAPRGSVPIVIERINGFAEDIALTLAPVVSPPGVTGSFAPALVPGSTGAATLNLEIPASTGQGALMTLRVTGTSTLTGKVQTKDFSVAIEPLFSMSVTPNGGTASSNPPLDVLVKVSFDPAGPFAAAPPRVTFSLPPDEVPDGLQYQFLEGDVATTYSVGTTIHRTLRLITDGRAIPTGVLSVTATASLDPTPVYSAATFLLTVTPGFDWEYVENGATYTNPPTENVAISIGMQQRDNRPAIAWLEGRAGTRQVYLKRFDGTTFVASPSPGPGNGLRAPSGGDIEQARMALSRSDAAQVAFTYKMGAHEGSAVGLGTLGTGTGAVWSAGNEFLATATQHARSPRIATPTAPGQALALSYLVEEGESPVTASELFVRWTAGPGPLAPLPGPGGGSVNAAADGRVVRDSTSLALRPDGKPWVAWIEQPADASMPPVLWVRGHDGVSWGPPRSVPTVAPPSAGPTQLLVEPSGAVVVAWLEARPARAFPAQLLLARLDPASGNWSVLTNTGNDQGSLNIRREDPVRDMSLTLDAMGRLVIAWTEETNEGGSAISRLWAKRQSADGTWPLLGMVIDLSKARNPFIAGDSNSHLYVNWLRIYDTSPAQLRGDVFVARWVFP